jgi:hypothetical protein
MEAKRCALIRQTWYEAAKKNMKDGARLAFYEACFDFEFYGNKPDEGFAIFSDAALMFDMVVDALEADMSKAENIAQRNRRNGMLGGRPRKSENLPENAQKTQNPEKPSETQSDNVGYFGLSTTLHNTTLHNNKEKSLSMAKAKNRHKDIEKYDFFRVMFVFFYSGAEDPRAEAEKFYNYYAARDWQVGRGQHVRDKVALAKTWEIKDVNPGLISARQMYSGLIEAIDPEEPELLTDFVAMIRDEEQKKIILRFSNGNRSMDLLEKLYLRPMSAYIYKHVEGDGWGLDYQLIQ